MVMGQRKDTYKGILQYKNQPIEYVDTYNYLGVEIDTKMTFEDQLKKCLRQANRKLFMLSKIAQYISSKTRALLYEQLVLLHLDYCDFVPRGSLGWGLLMQPPGNV